MEAGKLRFLLEIQNPTITDLGSAEHSETYSKVGTIWADVSPLSTQERSFAAQSGSVATHSIKCRYTSLINTATILVWTEKISGTVHEYYVTSYQNVGNRNRELAVQAVEKTP
jgi:SPP1 family predicted phage head-tail adaptor